MAIPFRDAADIEELGLAGFIVIQPAPAGPDYVAALFVINGRGEPQEFTYSRVTVGDSFGTLWRPPDLRRHAERSLVAALLEVCPVEPRVLLARAEETDPDLFRKELIVAVPVARVAPKPRPPEETDGAPARVELTWYPAAPQQESPERRLVDELTARGLLVEPFERAVRGLNEVYDPESEFGPAEIDRGRHSARRRRPS